MKMRASPLLILATILIMGCGGDKDEADKSGVLKLVATTGQVGDMLKNIGGEQVEVISLMGPGIDPHLYKASAGDVERLRRADAIFYNGHHLEAKMGEVIGEMGSRKPTLALSETIPDSRLLSPNDYEGLYDPHIWFDLDLWRLTVDAVVAKLSELDPEHSSDFESRGKIYQARMDKLQSYALEQFARIPEEQRVLITAHDAFNYLGRAYGLEVRGLQGISTVSEAGTGDVQDLAAFITERKIPALFAESSVSPRAIEAVRAAVQARGFDVQVGGEIFSDALGDEDSPAGTYLGMFRHNVDTIVSSLLGEGSHEQH
jgi:manganese/zinc/iron transport system substrate-binding protein